MIQVTKVFLPKQEEYQSILKRSWDKHWITNRGELVLELESKLKTKYGISNLIATTNGTLPLQIAIKALGLSGEIITTPFSYIATASSIHWEGCKPVFVDIDEKTFNVDVSKIEREITTDTTAIMVTHVFGNPCDILAIETLAQKHNLKVIYDAAHCFGVSYKGKSIFNYGDVSTCSFHATKIFHTGEGGAMMAQDKTLHDKLYYHHNFGHKGREDFYGLGVNAKMSELQAAMGLSVLPYFESIIEKREKLYKLYLEFLQSNGNLSFQKITDDTVYNYSYFPVVFKTEMQLEMAIKELNEKDIYPRRYFYPSLNTIPYLNGEQMPVSESISKRILCLPLYYDLTEDEVETISKVIIKSLS